MTERIRRDHWSDGVTYLNPDEIAQSRFGDWNDAANVRSAAEWVEAERERLLAAGESLAFETVLSMPDKLAFIERAQGAGYFVRAFFVGTSDPTINAARVARRVMEGGHTVPIEKIVARCARSTANLERLIEISDRAYVYDNSVDEQEARLVARSVTGSIRKMYLPKQPWATAALVDLPRHAEFTLA